MIAEGDDQLEETLHQIITDILEREEMLTRWKDAIFCLIYKKREIITIFTSLLLFKKIQ